MAAVLHIQPALLPLVHPSSLILREDVTFWLLTKGIWLAATGFTDKHE